MVVVVLLSCCVISLFLVFCVLDYIAVICEAMLRRACTKKQRLDKNYDLWVQELVLAYEMTAFRHKQDKKKWVDMAKTDILKLARRLMGTNIASSGDHIPTYKVHAFMFFIPTLVRLGILVEIPKEILAVMVKWTTKE